MTPTAKTTLPQPGIQRRWTALPGEALSGSSFDPNSNLHKSTEQGRKAVIKVHFDSLDRPDITCLVAEDPATAAANTNDVSADVVIEQTHTQFNDADQAVATTNRQRFDDATGTGPLNGPHGDQPRSRDSFQAGYPDPIGRTRFQLNAGTNGGLPWQRPALCPEPSDTALVSQLFYAPDGGVHFRLDPMGVATVHQRDAARREIELTEGANVCSDRPAHSKSKIHLRPLAIPALAPGVPVPGGLGDRLRAV